MPKPLILFLLLLLPLYSWAEEDLAIPDIGDSADAVLSISEERKIGNQFMRNTWRNVSLISDPEVEAYIQALGDRLVSYLDLAEFNYTFFVVDSPQINAFAVPGGYIGINAGLIIAADNESELASVMAHEIAHVSQRHISRVIEKSSGANMATLAAIIAAIALSSQGGDASMAALSVGMAGSEQAMINYTRIHEKEADRVGIQLLAGANYDPQGMAHFFEKLHQESRYYENGLPEILMTHPVTLNRLAEAKSRAEQLAQSGVIDQPAFQAIRAKVLVSTNKNSQQLEQQTTTLLQKHAAPEQQYQLALLENQNGKYKAAEQRLRKLILEQGEHSWLTIALANSLYQQRLLDEASNIYQNGLQIYPGNKGLTLHYAELLIQQQDAQRAVKLLEEYLRNRSKTTPGVYQIYARALDLQGNHTESAAALGEYFFRSGHSAIAIQHLERAVELAKDNPFRLPALQQRLEEIKMIALEEKQQ